MEINTSALLSPERMSPWSVVPPEDDYRYSVTRSKIILAIHNKRLIPDEFKSLTVLNHDEALVLESTVDYTHTQTEQERSMFSFITDGKSDISGRTMTADDIDLVKLRTRLEESGADPDDVDKEVADIRARQT